MWVVSRSVLTQLKTYYENILFHASIILTLDRSSPRVLLLEEAAHGTLFLPVKAQTLQELRIESMDGFKSSQSLLSSWLALVNTQRLAMTGLKSSLKTTWSVLVLLLCCWLCRWCWNERCFSRKCRKDFANDMLLQNASNKLSRKTTPDW